VKFSKLATASWLPVASLLFAASMWGVFWFPLRWLEARGLAGLWAAYFMYAATLLIALPMLWRHRGDVVRRWQLLLGIGIFSAWCNVSFFLAVLEGNIVRVILLFYLSPVWTILLGRWLLREHPGPSAWFHLALAFCGALIMLWKPQLGLPWPEGRADWLAITSGMAFAASNVLTRKGEDLSVHVKTGVAWSGCFILAAVWIAFEHVATPIVSAQVIGIAFALGLFGIALMTTAVLYGVSNMPVHRSAVILLFELVVGAVSQQLLTTEVMTTREWLGGALIIFAAWLTVRKPSEGV